LKAYARSNARREAVLVLAGVLGVQNERKLRALARELGVEPLVKFLGFVPDDLVPALYRQCRIHVFASRYEGFGLPLVEAFACGAPTITSPGSSLDEVAGGAAEVVPFADADALCAAMDRLFWSDARCAELRGLALEHVKQFTWKSCAERTVASWRRTLDGA
jgi:alpha-1,3-rhamnosyl/mannosyltransferase